MAKTGKANHESIDSAEMLAREIGLSRAFALDPKLVEAAFQRARQPLSPLLPGYGPTTEPALGFRARG